jgi:Tfp pilus assembly protein PilX
MSRGFRRVLIGIALFVVLVVLVVVAQLNWVTFA